MSRHQRTDQAVMRRSPMFGWRLVRQDGTAVYSTPKKESRIGERLMREFLQDSDLRVSYHRILTDGTDQEWPLTGRPTYVEVFARNHEPATVDGVRIFTDDGHLNLVDLKKNGWHQVGAFKENE